MLISKQHEENVYDFGIVKFQNRWILCLAKNLDFFEA
jgi:hypothetical protein